jgi:ArsR family transcriptional regulator, arsenate/arsenite/antimonite-responsive transcriptional repressor
MRTIEKLYKALADRNRLRILKMLEARPLCVCEITHVMGIAQSSVSRHLAILRDAGLVDDKKNGQWTIYSLSGAKDDAVATLVTSLRRWGNDDPQVTADSARLRTARRESLCPK